VQSVCMRATHDAIFHQPQPTTPILVNKKYAAALLSVCLRTIDKYIAELPCRRIGKRVLIPYSALVAFAKRDHLTEPEPDGAAEQGAQP
jgi:hypothetical protein